MFVRSPHARAKIKKVDFSKASKAPGVVSILTGADIVNDKIGGLIAGWKIVSEDGTDMKVPAHPPLASDAVKKSKKKVLIAGSLPPQNFTYFADLGRNLNIFLVLAANLFNFKKLIYLKIDI